MQITETIHPEIADVRLSEEEQRTLIGIAQDIRGEIEGLPEHQAVDAMLDAGEAAAEDFPGLYGALSELSTHESWKTMVVHGPVPGLLPPTPDRYLEPGENPLFKEDVYRGVLLGMMGLYAYGYDSQQPGNIHNNVIAIKNQFGVRGISANPVDELGLHVEDASYNLGDDNISPDWLTIHALRNPHVVPSLVSIPDLTKLSREARQALEEEFFVNHTNPGQGGDQNNADKPVAVLYGPNGEWVRLNTEQLDLDRHSPRHRAALQEFVDLAVASTIDLDFLPGDIVINDNRRILHGRAQYKRHQMPRFDGEDRWQRRVVAADDASRIQRFETVPRIVSPQAMLSQAA